MVDIHTHILPGIDDGSVSWEMTAEMCRVALADGITHIVATPHANDTYDYDRVRYTEMLGELFDAAKGRLSFSLGCDFHFSPGNLQDAVANRGRYTIGDTQYLLVEFSNYGLPVTVEEDLLMLMSNGMVPIITHPERNPILQDDPEMVLEFAAQGCVVQVTANSFTGFWGKNAKKIAEWLLRKEAVHVIASDAHDPRRRRPVLSEAREVVAKLASPERADALVTHNPTAIVEGRRLPYQPGKR